MAGKSPEMPKGYRTKLSFYCFMLDVWYAWLIRCQGKARLAMPKQKPFSQFFLSATATEHLQQDANWSLAWLSCCSWTTSRACLTAEEEEEEEEEKGGREGLQLVCKQSKLQIGNHSNASQKKCQMAAASVFIQCSGSSDHYAYLAGPFIGPYATEHFRFILNSVSKGRPGLFTLPFGKYTAKCRHASKRLLYSISITCTVFTVMSSGCGRCRQPHGDTLLQEGKLISEGAE